MCNSINALLSHRINRISAVRCALGIAVCIFLGSCATPYKTVLNRYHEAPNCCKDFREFEYEKLSMPDSRKFRIDEGSKAFDFDTGKSYFKAYELPRYSSPYRIVIKSYLMGDTVANGYIFSPAIIFLDEEYEITRMIQKNVFCYTTPSLSRTWVLRRKIEGTITMTQANAAEAYMIILTTDELLGAKEEDAIPIVIPFSIQGVFGVIPTGFSEKVLVPHSPIGKFTITLLDGDY